MSETPPGETPVERRLWEMARQHRMDDLAFSMIDSPDGDAIDAGREAIKLLRRYRDGELDLMAFDGLMRALLARCEGDR